VLAFAFPFLRLKAISIAFVFLFARVCGRLTITMKTHPRIRKTIKWGGAAVTVLLVVVWIGSGWIHYVFVNEPLVFHAVHGGVGVQRWSERTIAFMRAAQYRTVPDTLVEDFELGLWPELAGPDSPFAWQAFLPIWPLILLVSALTCAAWRLDILSRRRAMLNLCPKCRYDRTGLPPQAPCPECGAAPSPPAPAQPCG
jgi:hypothetical protein